MWTIPSLGAKAAAIRSELLGKEVRYTGEDMDTFEERMRQQAPSWSAFDIRMMFRRYLQRGFVAGEADLETVTARLGHAPRPHEDCARETAEKWEQELS